MRGGASADPLIVGPGAPLRPVGGEDWEALPLADAWEDEDEAAEQGPVGGIKLDGISYLFLLFLCLWLLLG